VRCPRCGNENSDENRFCGMCGGTLLPPADPVASAPAQAAPRSSTIPSIPSPASSAPSTSSVSAQPQIPVAPRTAAPVSDDVPSRVTHISGPSFLGLNDPAPRDPARDPAPRKRASLSIDPHTAPSSSNLDYLLEDEEEPRSGGAGKFILILVALAVAVGLGYLRWKNHGFPSFGSASSKPSAAAQNSDSPDGSSTTAAGPPASSATSSSTAPAASQPAAPGASSGDPNTGNAAGAPANVTPATSTPSSTTPATNPVSGSAPPASASTSAPATNSGGAANSPPDAASTPPAPAATVPAATAPDSPVRTPARTPATTPAPVNPKPTASVERATKPHAGIRPARPVDPVSEAQKYIYGQGVTQDCDRGMRLLKPAADQANPAAMVEMGALYSAGLCTPHDLPTAYRWFALALRKDPDNMAVQTDLQKLWGEMTQPERQLAIKLSQ
jgi:hypothetical protein